MLLIQRKERKDRYCWEKQARESQRIPKGDWKIWLILAGRGFGKTRTGAETVRQWVQQGYRRICLLGENFSEVRKVMIEGESGLLNSYPPKERPSYFPSLGKVVWPCGAVALSYSAASYQGLRGPQFDGAWVDELGKFPCGQEAWDQLMLGLRLGKFPKVIVTTTPRPTAILKCIMERDDVVMTRGTSFENSDNLAASYLAELEKNYLGTRLGAQEIQGEILQVEEGGLWRPSMITHVKETPPLKRVVVAIDPAVTFKPSSDETGMVVVGEDEKGNAYVLQDLSGKFSAQEWIHLAVQAYHTYKADRIVAEVNNGGDLVEQLLRQQYPNLSYSPVTATRSKYVRAEPVAALYEQGKVFHAGYFSTLESQMLNPKQSSSPDRLDALVWAITALFFPVSKKAKLLKII